MHLPYSGEIACKSSLLTDTSFVLFSLLRCLECRISIVCNNGRISVRIQGMSQRVPHIPPVICMIGQSFVRDKLCVVTNPNLKITKRLGT